MADEIFPLNFVDNLSTGRVSILSETLLFKHVLDPEILRNGLAKLVQHGDWRKFGGRLRVRSDGPVEVHVPREFTADRPAVGFSTQAFDVKLEDHELGALLPKATVSPSLHAGPRTLDQCIPFPDLPDTLEHWTQSDRPILRLHVASFTDATVVILVWPHVVAGGQGVKEIISAWSKALHDDGTGDRIPALLGAHKDILDGIGTDADNPPPYALSAQKIGGFGFAKFVMRLLWDVFWRPKVESRAICLPGPFIAALRASALRELHAAHPGGEEPAPFLSESDVLQSWLTRFVGRTRGGNRPALVITSLDVMKRLSAPWDPRHRDRSGVYVQNTAGCVYTTFGAESLLRAPLGLLCHELRSSIQGLATDEQIRSQLRIFRSLGHTGMIPLFGDADAHLMSFSNWTNFKIFQEADFSPAVVEGKESAAAPAADAGESQADAATPVGSPCYIHCQALGENKMLRNCFNVTGKDWQGNYWVTAFLYPEDWQLLEDYMEDTRQEVCGPLA